MATPIRNKRKEEEQAIAAAMTFAHTSDLLVYAGNCSVFSLSTALDCFVQTQSLIFIPTAFFQSIKLVLAVINLMKFIEDNKNDPKKLADYILCVFLPDFIASSLFGYAVIASMTQSIMSSGALPLFASNPVLFAAGLGLLLVMCTRNFIKAYSDYEKETNSSKKAELYNKMVLEGVKLGCCAALFGLMVTFAVVGAAVSSVVFPISVAVAAVMAIAVLLSNQKVRHSVSNFFKRIFTPKQAGRYQPLPSDDNQSPRAALTALDSPLANSTSSKRVDNNVVTVANSALQPTT